MRTLAKTNANITNNKYNLGSQVNKTCSTTVFSKTSATRLANSIESVLFYYSVKSFGDIQFE